MTENQISYAELPRVAHVDESNMRVIINRGSDQDVKIGDRYLVFGLGIEVHDPETGDSLGQLEEVRGRGKVVHVQLKMAVVESTTVSAPVVRKSTPLGALGALFAGQVIEEQINDPIPFSAAVVGDFAKPI
jgi:hypothetical protein